MPIFYPDILENNNSNYPLVDATFLKGNAYPLAELTDTGSIPTDKRRVGLIVFTSGSQEWYGYKGQDVSGWDTPSNWEQIGAGGGGSTDYISNVAYDTGSISFTGVGSAFDGVISINALTSSLVSNSQTSSFVTNDETGSFYYSSSVNLNTVTFFQGDGTTESVTVDTGSAVDISALNLHTGSINTFTGSIQTEVDNLTAATSSYVTNDETGSFLYSGSYNSATNAITLYSIDQDYDLDLSGLAGGSGGIAITASYTGSELTKNARSFDFEGNGVNATNVGNAVTVTVTQVDTGSFYYSSSVELNTVTFFQGDGTTESVTVDTGSSATIDTGSFYYSSSVELNTITFFQGDGTTESTTIDTGSATDISALNLHTGSINTFTGSIQTEVDNLTAATSSYVTNDETGSFYYSSSVNLNTVTFYQGDGTTESVTVDTGSAVAIDTGSFYISSSVNLNTITFTQGDGTTESVTVDTGSAVAIDTGSFYISSSVNLNTITFTQGDGTTESVTVDTGSTIVPGNDTEVIYNKNGDFHATASFTFDNNGGPGLTIDGSVENQSASVTVSGSDVSNLVVGESLIWNSVDSNLTSINRNYAASGKGNQLIFQTDTGNEGPCWVLGGALPTDNSTNNANFNILPGYNTSANRTNDREYLFRVRKTITGANQPVLLEVSRSGQVYMPELENTTTPHIVGYDSTTGELTYYSTGSFGSGGSTDISALNLHTGSINTFTGSIQTEVDNLTALTSSYVTNDETGSFYYSSSVELNTITFFQGDGTTEIVTVDTGSDISLANTDQTLTGARIVDLDSNELTFDVDQASRFLISSSFDGEVQISGLPDSAQPHVIAYNTSDGTLSYVSTGSFGSGGGSTDTGSLLTTGSISNTTLTLTKGDGTTFDLTVTGSNIYNTDGTLTADRAVGSGPGATGKNLTFEFLNANFIINSDPAGGQVQINNLDTVETPRVVGYADGVLTAMPTSSFKPGGPVNTFQFNKNNAFSGSSVFFDSVDKFVGIGESSPDRPLHITDIDPVAIKLERTDAPEVGIQFFGNGASGGGAIIRGLNNDFEVIQRDTATSANERNLFISASGEVYAPRLNIKSTKNLLYYDDSNGEILQHRDVLDKIAAPTGSVQYTTGGASATTSSFVTVAGTIRTTTGETSHASEALSHLNGKTLGTDAFITATWADTSEASNQEQFCVLASISGSGQLVVETSTVNTGRSDAIIFQGIVLI